MYQTPIAVGLGGATGVGVVGSVLQDPGTGATGASSASDPMVASAHQVLAFTGFAFGAYIALGLVLIIAGLVIRHYSTLSRSSK